MNTLDKQYTDLLQDILDKGIFHNPSTRFVEAIYTRDGFETEIIYEGELKDVKELKNKLIELGQMT